MCVQGRNDAWLRLCTLTSRRFKIGKVNRPLDESFVIMSVMKIQTCPNCNVRVGIGSNGICPSCKKPAGRIEDVEIADSGKNETADPKLHLWNPNAAANWSLLFTPAFGAYLHAANWTTLGDAKRANENRRWIWITVAFLLFNILTIFFPTSPSIDYVLRIVSLLILIYWYFGTAKPQINLVKKKFGNQYTRRSWWMPLFAGMGAIGLYFAACFAISVRVTEPELPSCASTEVVQLLDEVIRSTPVGETTKSIDGHREVSFDRIANVRHGECVAHLDSGDIPVKFIVEWQDREKGMFQVQILDSPD